VTATPSVPRPDSPWRRITRGTPGKWSFWRYNWIVNRLVDAAAEKTRPYAHGTLLDIGCGSMRARRWYEGRVTRYIGIDLASSPYLEDDRLTAFARAEELPFRDGSVDTVLSVSMLTCVPEPQRVIDEAHRVLSPGGTLIMEFTQMVPLHDEPHDYFRFTRYGAESLLRRAGFEIVESTPVGGLMTRVALTAIAALNRINRGPTRVLTELPVRVLYMVIQLVFALLDRIFFDPREVLGHMVVARKVPGAPRS
jgi:SAM-dependent methyltransferase